MKGYFINSKTDEHGVIEVEPSLDELYRLIECDCITVATREIGGNEYAIVLDDEGLLKPNRIAATSMDSIFFGVPERLAGNLVIFKKDWENLDCGYGSLTDEDVIIIKMSIGSVPFGDGSEHPVLFYAR